MWGKISTGIWSTSAEWLRQHRSKTVSTGMQKVSTPLRPAPSSACAAAVGRGVAKNWQGAAYQLLALLLRNSLVLFAGPEPRTPPLSGVCKLACTEWRHEALPCTVLLRCVVQHPSVCACAQSQTFSLHRNQRHVSHTGAYTQEATA